MIGTIVRLGWTNLMRDRVALFLTFLLPLVFFSIFAAIFGGGGGGGDGEPTFKPLRVLWVDEDQSEVSSGLGRSLAGQEGLVVEATRDPEGEGEEPTAWTRETAFRAVRTGKAAAAVVVPAGFAQDFGRFGQPAETVIELIYDASNPMAQYTVTGLLQAASFQAAPTVLMERGFEMLEGFGDATLTPGQREAMAAIRGTIDQAGATGGGAGAGLVTVEATAAHDDGGSGEPKFSVVAYYAAGIGVMFLLFSMTAAAGTLLDDQDSGALERLLTSNLTMTQLLTGKWLFYLLIGTAQVLLMFGWGAVAFSLDLSAPKTLAGLAVMAVTTAAAAASFGLVLATLCKSRAQLGGISTIVILIMSAVGGSMVPRFVMPDFMGTLSKFTFNGWALDGFLKVFWYNDPEAGVVASLVDLTPQVGVLTAACVVFLWLARRLARRWESQ